MADIAAPPVAPNAAQGVIVAPAPVPGAIDVQPDGAPAPPAEPEVASETLYIQNLNEKIRIPGMLILCRIPGLA